MSEKQEIFIDDSSFKETTRNLERERSRRGVERSTPPDFAAVAAWWKARQAGDQGAASLKTYRFIVMVHAEDGQFRAYTPTLEGCEARGSTPQEAKQRLLQVLYTRLTELASHGETPPSDEGAEVVNVVFPVLSQ